jgi:hypothetical protein
MVDRQPKQVVCQSCGARHGYRQTPARQKPSEDAPTRTVAGKPRKTAEQLQEERRRDELNKLRDEVISAKDVIAFDARRRYKAGEIIDHPDYGRGKIETALKLSIVVRFTTGRRSLVLK